MPNPNTDIYNVNYDLVEVNLTPPNHRTPVLLLFLNALLYPLQWVHNNLFNDYANGSNYPFYNDATTYNIGDRVIDVDNAVYECEVNNVLNVSPHNNLGLQVGSYSFAGTGSDNLNGGALINANSFTGQSVSYHLTIKVGGQFGWDDNMGNSSFAQPINSNVNTLLSFGVSIDWSTGTFNTGDQYYFTVINNVVWWQVSPDYRGVRPRTNYNAQKLVFEAILNQFFRTTFRQPPYGQLPDIYIVNNVLKNFAFIVGETEDESSVAVYSNNEAINFIEYSNSDYNFSGNDYTIFVPASLYFSFAPTGVASIVVTYGGEGYFGPPTAIISAPDVAGGVQATATVTFAGGQVVGITVTNPGSGYLGAPTVSFSGGSPTIPADAYAVPSNTTQGDNTIRNFADRYNIAGMIYNIQPY